MSNFLPPKPGFVRFFYLATLQKGLGGASYAQRTMWGTVDARPGATRLELLEWFQETQLKGSQMEGSSFLHWQCEPDTYEVPGLVHGHVEPDPVISGALPGRVEPV